MARRCSRRLYQFEQHFRFATHFLSSLAMCGVLNRGTPRTAIHRKNFVDVHHFWLERTNSSTLRRSTREQRRHRRMRIITNLLLRERDRTYAEFADREFVPQFWYNWPDCCPSRRRNKPRRCRISAASIISVIVANRFKQLVHELRLFVHIDQCFIPCNVRALEQREAHFENAERVWIFRQLLFDICENADRADQKKYNRPLLAQVTRSRERRGLYNCAVPP